MADEIQGKVRRFLWATPSGAPIGPAAGMSADEVKISQGVKVLTPDIAPIAQRGPVEFIQPTTSSEALRLATPEAANPYATPTGPVHDHIHIRRALGRRTSRTWKALMDLLRNPPSNVEPEALDRMRASAERVDRMNTKVLMPFQERFEFVEGMRAGQQLGRT